MTPLLAADIDQRIVVLDVDRARVMLLDDRSERLWRTAVGLTDGEIAARLGEPLSAIVHALRALRDAGLVQEAKNRWHQAPVTWV